jgi:hypothetical protein
MLEQPCYPFRKNITEKYKDKITKPNAGYKTETALMTNGYTLLYDGENDRTDR